MNRRAFLTAIGAVATQQKFGTFSSQEIPETLDLPLITITRFPYIQNVHGDRADSLGNTRPVSVVGTAPTAELPFASARSRVFSSTDWFASYIQYTADLTDWLPAPTHVYGVSVNEQDIVRRRDAISNSGARSIQLRY
jgi:hypothetical protein